MKTIHRTNTAWRLIFTVFLIASLLLGTSPAVSADSKNDPSAQNSLFRKNPYLIYTGNNTQMKIVWQLKETARSMIRWGMDSSYSLGSARTKEYGNDHQHAYTIKRLKPGTCYYYTVMAGEAAENSAASFVTAPEKDADSLKFFVYGDTRSFPRIHNEIAETIITTFQTDPDYRTFVLLTGDMVTYGAEEFSWGDEIFNPANNEIQTLTASLPLLSCAGNHELYFENYKGTDNSLRLFKKYFPYPFVKDTYWSFDYGPAHFVILDQYSENFKTKEIAWLEKDLQKSSKPWKFVCLHEPGWSAGGEGAHPNNLKVQQLIQPLLEKYQVTAVFAGHNHYYARALVNGVYHITTGGGGAPLYTADAYAPKVTVTAENYHYCEVEIEANTLLFKALKTDGAIIDTFTLNITEK